MPQYVNAENRNLTGKIVLEWTAGDAPQGHAPPRVVTLFLAVSDASTPTCFSHAVFALNR